LVSAIVAGFVIAKVHPTVLDSSFIGLLVGIAGEFPLVCAPRFLCRSVRRDALLECHRAGAMGEGDGESYPSSEAKEFHGDCDLQLFHRLG
jgi:hypothetical protein